MSYMGYVLCRVCKLKVCLGKLRRDETGRQVGFKYNGLDEAALGGFVLRFLAEHVKHDVIVPGDDAVYEMSDLAEYDTLSLEPGPGGTVVTRRQPCEPPIDRRRRNESGWRHPVPE